MLGAMPGQGLQVGPFAVEEVQYQKPAEDQLVPMVETRPQDPQVLCPRIVYTDLNSLICKIWFPSPACDA
jgi:hypothetical protein